MHRFVPALCLLTTIATAGAGQAFAQSQSGFTAAELDRMSQQRMNTLPPRTYGPPLPANSITGPVLHAPSEAVQCLGVPDYTPILAAPHADAQKIGMAAGRIAATSTITNGWRKVMFSEGHDGFVPESVVRPFRNPVNPGSRCRIDGIRPNGVIQFRYY